MPKIKELAPESTLEGDDEVVTVVVREEGDAKISTGVHTVSGEEVYVEGETFQIPLSIATALKKRYYVDIVKDKKV